MTRPKRRPQEVLDPDALDGRGRYQLLTSLVVPRPIAWISTFGEDETPNLAPFSFYSAVSATPMLVSVSIGRSRAGPKDTLRNLSARRAFCVNVVGARDLEAMNLTSGGFDPDVDEFDVAGLAMATDASVDAPYVAGAPGVLECELRHVVELDGSPNTLCVGQVKAVRLSEELERVGDTLYVDARSLEPVGRLWGGTYSLLGEVLHVPRPG